MKKLATLTVAAALALGFATTAMALNEVEISISIFATNADFCGNGAVTVPVGVHLKVEGPGSAALSTGDCTVKLRENATLEITEHATLTGAGEFKVEPYGCDVNAGTGICNNGTTFKIKNGSTIDVQRLAIFGGGDSNTLECKDNSTLMVSTGNLGFHAGTLGGDLATNKMDNCTATATTSSIFVSASRSTSTEAGTGGLLEIKESTLNASDSIFIQGSDLFDVVFGSTMFFLGETEIQQSVLTATEDITITVGTVPLESEETAFNHGGVLTVTVDGDCDSDDDTVNAAPTDICP